MTTHTPGHEGVGRIVTMGHRASEENGRLRLGSRVGVKWIRDACYKCEICQIDSTSCPYQQNSGRDIPGTLQQYVACRARSVTMIPEGIDSAIAAPLLCGKWLS